MKSKAALLLALTAFFAAAQPQQPEPGPQISQLKWLAGDWQTAGRMQSEEHWTQPAGGTMIGMARTVSGDKTVFFEFLRIEARADGIYYVAQPKGRPGVDFKATELDSEHVVFSNPQHDFPKRITYRRNGDGSLTARVEGDGSEKEKSEEYHFQPMPRP